MKEKSESIIYCLLICFCLGLFRHAPAEAGLDVHYGYGLADFSGPVKTLWARLAVAPDANEVYVFDPSRKDIRIFNDSGMQIFSFGEGENSVATATDIAVGEDGSLYVIDPALDNGYSIARLNYRGEPIGKIELKNIPDENKDFRVSRIKYSHGKLYFLDAFALKIYVFTTEGIFQKVHDLRPQLVDSVEAEDPQHKKLSAIEISGFNVDKTGNIYCTIPVLFAAFRLNTDGKLDIFGAAGSGPGKFGVVAGIAADSHGNIYVSDRLRSVVLVFDKSLKFTDEFGFRGMKPENLIVPDDIAVDNSGKIYVSQGAARGISVFLARLSPAASGEAEKSP